MSIACCCVQKHSNALTTVIIWSCNFQDNKIDKLDDLTPFFSAHYSMTTGYLARAVVNNVLQGGELATGSNSNDNDIGQEEPCRIS
jgi:phosphorylase kinase alpha/beta subunit